MAFWLTWLLRADIDVTEVGKNICMHTAAMDPSYWDSLWFPRASSIDGAHRSKSSSMNDEFSKTANKPAQVKEEDRRWGKINAFSQGQLADGSRSLYGSDLYIRVTLPAASLTLPRSWAAPSSSADAVHFVRGEGIEKGRVATWLPRLQLL